MSRKCIHNSVARRRPEALYRALGENQALVRRFSQCVGACAVAGHADRRARNRPDGNALRPRVESQTTRRATRAYDMFKRANYHSGLEGDHVFRKTSALNTRWRNLPAELKAPYQAAAEEENRQAEALEREHFVQFVSRCGLEDRSARRKTNYKSQRLRAVQQTLREATEHAIFQSGSRLCSFDAGFRPELVRAEKTLEEISDTLSTCFRYDYTPVTNPPAMPYFSPCAQTNGGECCTSDLSDYVRILTHNLYSATRDFKEAFPILLEFQVPAPNPMNEYAFLGRLIGVGKLAFFSKNNSDT